MMKLPELYKSKLFWISFIVLGGLSAFAAFLIGIQRANEIKSSTLSYVCDEQKERMYYITMSSGYSKNDVHSYLQVVLNKKNSIDFNHARIRKNEAVYVTNYLQDSSIARVILVRSKPSQRQPYREEHFIWVGYLSETPCK